MTTEEKELLNELLSRANGFRLALDCVLGEIEGLVGGEIDGLDEMVGNGIDADSLLDVYADDEDETMDGDDEDEFESCPKCGASVTREAAFTDEGEGEELGRTFYYCSEHCRETH